MATIDLVVVGESNAVCSGASVTIHCTLTGDVLTWNTPDGALNFIRGRSSLSESGSYHGRLQELNSTHLISNLTFTFTSQITISCSDGCANSSITVTVEGESVLATCCRLSLALRFEGLRMTSLCLCSGWMQDSGGIQHSDLWRVISTVHVL